MLRYPFGLRRYELRGLLVIWNSALAIFSIVGASRTAPELIHVLRHYGLFHSVCDPRFVYYYLLFLRQARFGMVNDAANLIIILKTRFFLFFFEKLEPNKFFTLKIFSKNFT